MEIKDVTDAEALITENLTCPLTGIIYRVEEFRTPISVQQYWNCQVSDIRPNLVGLKPNALSVGRAIITKDAQIKRKNSQNAQTVKDHMLHPTKGVQHTKRQAFRQHVVDSQTSRASILRQNSAPPQPQDKAFTFSAEQLIKFVANVAIQVGQSQVCYANPNQDARSQVCVAEFLKPPKIF